jgi:hypothetical protein
MPSPINNEVALYMSQGYSREEAEAMAYKEMNQRYARPEDKRPLPPKNNGEGFGVIEGIKTLLGIERSPEEVRQREEAKKQNKSASVQETEAKIGTSIASMMLGGPDNQQMYVQALQSKNPGAMLGYMAARATISAREKMRAKGALTDDTIWAAEDGVLDNALGEVFSYAKMYSGVDPDDETISQAYQSALTALEKSAEAERAATMKKPKGVIGAAASGRIA